MGGALFLSSPKEILEVVVPAIAKLLGDSSPEARFVHTVLILVCWLWCAGCGVLAVVC